MWVIREREGVEICRSVQFSTEMRLSDDFKGKFRAPVIWRINTADPKNQKLTASLLHDNGWGISQLRKTYQNSVFSVLFSRKSVSGRDEKFRRPVQKLPEFRIPRQIFPQFRCSANPDDPHIWRSVIMSINIGYIRKLLRFLQNIWRYRSIRFSLQKS